MKSGWLYHFWVKMVAFLLAAALAPLALMHVAGLIGRYDLGSDFYTSTYCNSLIYRYYGYIDYSFSLAYENGEDPTIYFPDEESSNLRLRVLSEDGTEELSNVSDGDIYCTTIGGEESGRRYEFYAAEGLPAQDSIREAAAFYGKLMRWGENAELKLIELALGELVLLIYLARASARRPDGTLEAGWQEKLPFDLYLALDAVATLCLLGLASELIYVADFETASYNLLALEGLCFCAAACVLGAWMTLCARLKLGAWWRNTVTCRALKLCWRIVKWCWRTFCAIVRGAWEYLHGIPMVWRTGIAASALVVFGAVVCSNAPELFLCCGFLLVLVACAFSMQLRKLQKEGEALAAGDLAAQVDTKHMFWDIKRHAENLNSIGDGMAIAVEKQLRSERLKTELITNVSHDIKTPLTSIINYVDLLQHEHTKEQEEEYLNVLKRQAFKLKKLTEDLVEASKASTGNLPVNAARCSMNELLTQVAGEYDERLSAADLTLVSVLAEKELFCTLDGALTSRVFDNLLTNICKYAQNGTRVYLTLEEREGEAVVTFKNTSRAALNIPAEELMERFVRGDSARTTVGNGLGLSIARSLTELQGGRMELAIDGDLFKAMLRFPLVA